MKKVFLFSAALLLFVAATFAQSSQTAIPYQGVARDSTGSPIANQKMNAQMSIFDSVATGTAIYIESDTFTTSNLGIFTINIGQGAVVSGTFSAINWSRNPKFLQVGLDPSGGSSFLNMGTAQLLNVPFALYALQSGTSSPPMGIGQQVPYFNHSGVLQSDSLFTRNDTNYATNILRTNNGVLEGITLGNSNYTGADGSYFSRYDSSAGHLDLIGEFYGPSALGEYTGHQIGIECLSNNGGGAGLFLQDSFPQYPVVAVVSGAGNGSGWIAISKYEWDTLFTGIVDGSTGVGVNGIAADTNMLQLVSNSIPFSWPTSDGTNGQILKTNGSGGLSWVNAGTTTGTAKQVPYFNNSGAIYSDSLFTRDSTYATQILRTTSGGVYEGFNLGPGLSGYGADGVFLTRIDTPEGHYDYIGEGNLWGSNAMGMFCTHGLTSNGASATIAIVDSSPVNSAIFIETTNDALTPYHGKEDISPTEVDFGINGGPGGSQSFIVIDTVTVHILAGTTTWNWPTVDGANGQSLTTDGSGNLSWGNNNFANKSVFTPTTGNTITAVWGNNIVNPSSGLSALTITLPASPVDNETVFFTFTNTITSLSFTGGTISGAGGLGSVSSVANGNVKYSLTYDSGSNTWY